MVGSSLALFGIAPLFMRAQMRPIHRLALAADAFGKGRNVPDFKLEGAEEVLALRVIMPALLRRYAG